MTDTSGPNSLADLKIDAANLYREESYTDLRVGSIRKLIPVKADGSVDSSRTAEFSGETQVLTQAGAIPIHARIPANNLQEAIDGFPAAMQDAFEQMMEEVRELQRREASRIVVPGKDIPPPKIQMP